MAITLDYSPIALGLGLAQKAGAAVRNRVVAQQDMEFIRQQQAAQQAIDQQYAQQIQFAMGLQQRTQEQEAARQAQAQALAIAQQHQAQVEAEARKQQQFQNNLATTKQTYEVSRDEANRKVAEERIAATAARQAATQKTAADFVTNYVDPSKQGMANAFYAATGKLPETVVPQNPSTQLDLDSRKKKMQYDALVDQIAIARTALKAATYNGDNMDHLGKGESPVVRGAVKGDEKIYQEALNRVNSLEAQRASVQTSLFGTQPAVGQQSAAAIIQNQQGAQGGQVQQQDAGSPPVVHNMAEYAALPSGTVYISANTGKTCQKP